jgi:hypothetical protein
MLSISRKPDNRRASAYVEAMNFRPTTLERAYQLAEGGECRTVSDIKQRLAQEGYDRIADQLYGRTITNALRDLCNRFYRPPAVAETG